MAPPRRRNCKLKSKLEEMKKSVSVPQQQYRMEIPLDFTRIRAEKDLMESSSSSSKSNNSMSPPTSRTSTPSSDSGIQMSSCDGGEDLLTSSTFIGRKGGLFDVGRGGREVEGDKVCHEDIVDEICMTTDDRTFVAEMNRQSIGMAYSYSRRPEIQNKSAAATDGGEGVEEDEEEDLMQAFHLGVIDGDEEIPAVSGQKNRTTDEVVSQPKTTGRRHHSEVDNKGNKEKFPCPHCHKASTTKNNLKRHIGTVHAKILAEMNALNDQNQNNQQFSNVTRKNLSEAARPSPKIKEKQSVKTSSPKQRGTNKSPTKPKHGAADRKKQAYSDKYRTYLTCLSEDQSGGGQAEHDHQASSAQKASGSKDKKELPKVAKTDKNNKSNGRAVDENGNPVKRKYNKPPLVHSCDFCNAEFKSNSNLRRHEREAHADEQPTNQCQFCPLFFFHVNQYRKHLQRDHRDRMTVDNQPIQRVGKKPIKKEVRDKAINEMVTKQETAPEPELPEFYCNECSRGFKTEKSYRYHRDYHKSVEAGLPYQFSGGPGTTPTIHRMGTTASTMNNIEPILSQHHDKSSFNEAPKSVTTPPPSTPIRCFSGGKPAAMLNMMPSLPSPAPLTTGTSTVMNRVKRNKQMPVTRVVSTGNFVPSSMKAKEGGGNTGEQKSTVKNKTAALGSSRQNLKRKLKVKSGASLELPEDDKWEGEPSSTKRVKSAKRESFSTVINPGQQQQSSFFPSAVTSQTPPISIFVSPSPSPAGQTVQSHQLTARFLAEDARFYNSLMSPSGSHQINDQTGEEFDVGSEKSSSSSSSAVIPPVPLIVPAEPKFRCPHCRMERFHHRFELDFHVRTCPFSPANRVSSSL